MSLNSKSPPSYGAGEPQSEPSKMQRMMGAVAAMNPQMAQQMQQRAAMQPPPPGGPPGEPPGGMQGMQRPPMPGGPPQGMAGLGAAAARMMPKTQERMAGALRRFQQR